MARPLAALVAIAVLVGPAPLAAWQAPPPGPRTHTVAEGETLRGLARAWYGDPLLWPLILEANRPAVLGPGAVEPGTVLVVPELGVPGAAREVPGGARVAVVAVRGGSDAGPADPTAPVPVRRAAPAAADVPAPAVPTDVVLGAPFLTDAGASVDSVAGFAPGGPVGASVRSARVGDRLRIHHRGAPPPPGTPLQAWRAGRLLEGPGAVALPTALLRVESVFDGGSIAVVERLVDRIVSGDRVRVLTIDAPSVPGAAVPVSRGIEVRILAEARPRAVPGPGDWVFLDAGADRGIRAGDEFVPLDPADLARPAGRLQVVSVQATAATARVVAVADPPLRPGQALRLDRRSR